MGAKIDFNIHNYDSLFKADKWLNNKINYINDEVKKNKRITGKWKNDDFALEI